MLYLDQPIGKIRGLMVYRDHENPSMFYYVPERPRLARSEGGVPEFVFLKYKRDITDNPDFSEEDGDSLGGGFLSFTVDLGVEDSVLRAVKSELSRLTDADDVQLAPIQFRKGSVRLSIMKDAAEEEGAPPDAEKGFTFFEEVYGTTMPSLFGDNRATFSIGLTREGATLIEAGLKTGISPIGVIYKLEFLGMRPAFNVKITARYDRIYNHLETEFGARGQIKAVSLAADIAAAFQKLRDNGDIKVEVTHFTDDEDLRTQAEDAFNWFKTELLKEFFESAMQPPSFMTRSSGGGLGILSQLQNLFGALGKPQSGGTATPVRGQPTTQPPTTAPPPSELSSGVNSTSDVSASTQQAAVAGGGGGGADSSIAPFQIAFSLKFFRQEELKTRTFEYSMSAAVAQEVAPQGLFSTVVDGFDLDQFIKAVNLDDDFFKRLIVDVSMAAGLLESDISSVAVNMEYPGIRQPGENPIHTDGFKFEEGTDRHVFTTWLNDRFDRNYRYKMDVHFKPNSEWIGKDPHMETGWIVDSLDTLVLNPLDLFETLNLTIQLGDMDSGEVSLVQVEVVYDDPVNDFHVERTFQLRPGEPAQHLKLRLNDNAPLSYRYRVLYFLTNNVRYQTEWVTTENPELIVNEPFQGRLALRMVPLLDQSNLLEAVVDLTYSEPDTGYTRKVQEIMNSTDGISSRSITLSTLSPDPDKYTLNWTIVRMDGSVFNSGDQVMEQTAAVISDGHGQTHRIIVKLPQSVSWDNMMAIKVDLEGLGENGDFTQAIFTPSQAADQTVWLVQPTEGQFRYRASVTAYALDGAPVHGPEKEVSDSTLIVQLPQ
jgi:hypothetical protein